MSLIPRLASQQPVDRSIHKRHRIHGHIRIPQLAGRKPKHIRQRLVRISPSQTAQSPIQLDRMQRRIVRVERIVRRALEIRRDRPANQARPHLVAVALARILVKRDKHQRLLHKLGIVQRRIQETDKPVPGKRRVRVVSVVGDVGRVERVRGHVIVGDIAREEGRCSASLALLLLDPA